MTIEIVNQDGLMVVSSRTVAEDFGKRHAHVMEKIEEKLLNRKIGSANWFIESTYKDSTGRELKEYLLTRDGFSFIVMGFTGAKADEFKIKYIEAFNEMERQLREQQPKLPSTYKEALLALVEVEEEKERLLLENSQKERLIGELKPKADYTDTILNSTGLVTITQIAKDYGMSGGALNKLLCDLGVQYFQSGQWLLYAKYHGNGYTHSKTYKYTSYAPAQMHTNWTQKGRLFLYNLLKSERGILPLIECEEGAE